MFDKLKAYKCYSNDVVFLKYIMDESDLEPSESKSSGGSGSSAAASSMPPPPPPPLTDAGSKPSGSSSAVVTLSDEFRPEFTHQIFGDEETIVGYKNLKINYYLTPGLLHAYIGLHYTDKISPRKFDGIEPDDVHAAFADFGCSPGFVRSLDVFCADKLAQDRLFRPFGEKIHEYHRNVNQSSQQKFKDITNGNGDDLNTTSAYEIYRVDANSAEFESVHFRDYLVRVQTMLVFFIETASFIDEEDPKWVHYFLYEKRKTSANEFRYVTAGYLSVYHFYAYPDKTRARVSQVLVMPPYQRAGHGAELLEAVYRDAASNADIVDVTAEGPSAEFVQLRDYVTTKLCSSLGTFRDVGALRRGFSSDMMAEALKAYKIPKLQSRRAYEIVRLANTNEHDEKAWEAFAREIKQRFYATFLKMSKFARASKMVSGADEDADDQQPSSSSSADLGSKTASKVQSPPESKNFNFKKAPINKLSSLSSRFGFESNPFGGNSKSAASNPFANAPELPSSSSSLSASVTAAAAGLSGKKTVTFGNVKNASYSSNDNNEEDEEDDEDEDEDEDGDEDEEEEKQEIDFNKLLVSEPDRRQYIEQQFEEAIKEYRKVTQRLEACRVLPF